jgi:hypothetical protein
MNSTDKNLDVLSNDTDPDTGDTKSIAVVFTPNQGGTVTISGIGANNSLLYSPAAGFIGIETFSYTMQDTAGLTNTATVTININFI